MASCVTDDDCGRQNYCDQDDQICVHEDLFHYTGLEIFCFILAGVLLGFHNLGGLGAGTIKIFILMLILNYSMKQATAFTYPVLFASKIADNIIAVTRKHPIFKGRPLIDYNVVLIFLPGTLLGSFIGAGIFSLIPYFALQIIQILFVGAACVLTSIKVKHIFEHHKQTKLQEQLKQQQEQQLKIEQEKPKNSSQKYEEDDEGSPVKEIKDTDQQKSDQNNQNQKNEENQKQYQAGVVVAQQEGESVCSKNTKLQSQQDLIKQKKFNVKSDNNLGVDGKPVEWYDIRSEIPLRPLKQIQEIENEINNKNNNNKLSQQEYEQLYQKQMDYEKTVPLKKVAAVFGMTIIMFIYYYIQGGKKADSPVGIDMCSGWYWAMYVVQFFIYAAFFYFIVKVIKEEEFIKVASKHAFQKFESHIGKIGLNKFTFSGFFCGLITGMIGFGGAITLVPTMAILGLHPRAATGTTSFLTTFYSSITVITALLGGQISIGDFGIMFGLTFLGSFIFTNLFNIIIEKLKLEGFTIVITAVLQFAMFIGSIAILIRDVSIEPFDTLTETDAFC
ncbi:hypothetical protein PPERSA_06909 [Pseudocohnilembus persalinus]|uniref:Sulfite exporter TauE/SafE n=1 Tax=Pseudocohnilembus persalinus TaxID=266149 RepID=A0A0V0QYJ9_PSEPJ|nr:hypothetical protein PPERSA_06909 [Pseudocohnilembus persalinus]|eukprot:KRX07294.1 hypothetical protein PPERSA_06909 [Pseudocohnilembus persalinus]